jgi:type I restriction enzyme S subunit
VDLQRQGAECIACLSFTPECTSYNEQKKIADVLELCDKEIDEMQSYYEKIQQQKKGLMQCLLTGQVRVRI